MSLPLTDRHSPPADHFRLAATIRGFEQMLLDEYSRGKIGGTTHTCIGQEIAAVGITAALDRDRDCVFSHHRGHGHFLAYCGEVRPLLAEILGRADGVCGAKGGSQHLHWKNFYSNGIQGGIVGNAVGVALAEKRKASGAVTLVWVGDGTFGEGLVYEAMNIAALWRLPVVFAVEANGIAQTTPTTLQMAGTIAGRCAAFGIDVAEIPGTDLAETLTSAGRVIDATRDDRRPRCLVSYAPRLGPHSKGDDTRGEAELKALWDADPLAKLRRAVGAQADTIEKEAAALLRDTLASLDPEAVS